MDLFTIYLCGIFLSHMFTLGIMYHIMVPGGPRKVFIEILLKNPTILDENARIVKIGAGVQIGLFCILYVLSLSSQLC